MEKREKTQIIKIRNENGDITTNSTEIKGIIREKHEQLCANKLDNLDEVNKFLKTQNLIKMDIQRYRKPDQTYN